MESSSDQFSDHAESNLLVGFELEFLMPYGDKDFHGSDPRWWLFPESDPKWRSPDELTSHTACCPFPYTEDTYKPLMPIQEQIFRAFHNAGIAVLPRFMWDQKEVLARVEEQGGKWMDNVGTRYQAVRVDSDVTCEGRRYHGNSYPTSQYEWAGLEVQTRVMPASDILEPRTDSELDRICQILRGKFRTQVNDRCGVHVNVGCDAPRGMGRLQMNKAIALYWIIEPILYEVIAPHRSRSEHSFRISHDSVLAASRFNVPERSEIGDLGAVLHEETQAMRDCIPDCIQNLPGWNERMSIARIFAAKDIQLFEDLLLSASNNIWRGGLACRSRGGKNVLEFRQLEGSLDPGLVKLWARVCLVVVTAASLDASSFKGLMQKVYTKVLDNRYNRRKYGWQELLRDLGASASDIEQ